MSLKKNILFTNVIIIIFILTGEAALRVAGFTYFPEELGFKLTPGYRIFEKAGENFQTKMEKRMTFIGQSFPVEKRPGEIRIFVLGGSSIFQLGNMERLRDKLNGAVKGKFIRIINVGGNSYGTTRLILCLQEILDYGPDIVILYSGHNEYEEEFVREMLSNENVFKTFDHKLIGISRVYQFLSRGIHETAGLLLCYIDKNKNEGRIPFFPPGVRIGWRHSIDKGYVLKRYEKNINEMIDMARNRKVKIAVSIVAYNRMAAPAKSADSYYLNGMALYDRGDFSAAKPLLEAGIDADLEPHRASETTNAIIKKISVIRNVPLIDVDRDITSASKDGIPGFDLFSDHCHLNEAGRLLLLDAFHKAIMQNNMLE